MADEWQLLAVRSFVVCRLDGPLYHLDRSLGWGDRRKTRGRIFYAVDKLALKRCRAPCPRRQTSEYTPTATDERRTNFDYCSRSTWHCIRVQLANTAHALEVCFFSYGPVFV